MSEDEILDLICEKLSLECWFEGKTLTVMLPEGDDGQLHLAKFRLVNVTDKPSTADLRGEPA